MKVHLIGSLLCAGLLTVATSGGGFAAGDKKQPAKAGAAINASASNVKSPPEAKATGKGAGGGSLATGQASGKRQH